MLRRKMLRDIKFNLSQFITIFLMVFIGVMAYSGIRSYMDGMKESADKFYSDCNLQELEITGSNFTLDDIQKIKEIEHVNKAERKLSLVANLADDEDKSLNVNFIESNEISKFNVVSGDAFDKEKSGIWIDEYFADLNDLKVGDTLKLKYNNLNLEEKIVGIINTPDHVYSIKDESAIFPSHDDWGYSYLSTKELPEGFDIFNYVIVDIDEKENQDFVKNEIIENVPNALVVTKIEDTLSYSTYQGEIEEGETYVGVFSGIFLFIAILSVITTMTRIVKKQRVQIGTLKALGFTKRKITAHYVGFGFWISTIATVLGLIAGPCLIGKVFIDMEMEFFQVPNGHSAVDPSSFVVGILTVLIISLITYFSCRGMLKENAAETLRISMPKIKNKNLNFTTKGIFKNLSFSSKWNLRDIARNKTRTFMGIAGVVGCTMLILCGLGIQDSMNHFIDMQFSGLYNFENKLTLNENITEEELAEITEKYGNNTSMTLGIEIRNGESLDSNNAFVDDSNSFVRFMDGDENFISLKDNGITVTQKLAEMNGYKIGDKISWHIYGNDTFYETEIVALDMDPQNQNIKMTKSYLESLGITYKPDTVYTNENLNTLDEIAGVELIQNLSTIKDGMSNMLGAMKTMVALIIVIAVVLGVIIIYNLGILSFSEKQYQFATLKVLGFKDNQIQKIYVKQNNWITVVAIIIGIPLGYVLIDFIFKSALSDKYDFGAYVKPLSYILSVIGTYIVSVITSRFLSKKIKKIDMVSSLKSNE